MKKFILATAALFIAASAFAYDDTTFAPKGNLSTYTKTEYSVVTKFGEYYRTPVLKHVHLYDADGYETTTNSYNAKDALLDKTTYKYTAEMNLGQTQYLDDEGSVIWTEACTYNSDGTLKSVDRNDASGILKSRTIYTYAEKKKTVDVYDGEGALLSKTVITLVAVGESEKDGEVVVYNADGSLRDKTVNTYLESGLISQSEVINASGNSEGKTVYKYTATNAIKEVQDFDGEGVLVQRKIYKVDAKGNPTSINTYAVADKFGETVNELTSIESFVYKYR